MTWFRSKIVPGPPPEPPIEYLYNWDFTESSIDTVNNKDIKIHGGATWTKGVGVKITGSSGYVELFPELIPTTPTQDAVMELDIGDMSADFSLPMALIASFKTTAALGIGYYNSQRWVMMNTNDGIDEFQNSKVDLTNPLLFKNSNLKIVFHNDITLDMYVNGTHAGFCDYHTRYSSNNPFRLIGGYQQSSNKRRSYYNFTVKKAKIYYQPIQT